MHISEHFTPVESLVGGALIGSSATMMLLTTGRIAGISGICGGALQMKKDDMFWRVLFLAGLASGSFLPQLIAPSKAASVISSFEVPRPLWVAVVGGLLVGFGTRMGSGCTSGHGVCGLARRSMRSLTAVGTFMATGVLAATVGSLFL